MMIFCLATVGGRTPAVMNEWTRAASHSAEREMLMKPGPATSSLAMAPSLSHSFIALASRIATSRGALTPSGSAPLALSMPQRAIAELFW